MALKSQEIHLITGGGGYIGCHLAAALIQNGIQPQLLDITQSMSQYPIQICDIRNYSELSVHFKNVSCVYHIASYGMSGREQLKQDLIEAVNILGTKNVIQACLENNVPHLVYTSTYNVVFGGQEIINGDESLPYFPLNKHPDHYSRTKSVAEQMVLAANGTLLHNDTDKLYTCSLRLAGVYGPGELRHVPRVVNYIRSGLFSITYGSDSTLVDFLHIENLVQAHLAAGKALLNGTAAGQAYFISDNKPINNFQFFKPLIEGLGYKFPKINLPLKLVYFTAFLLELLHWLIGRFIDFQPFLTRTEVYKTGVTHWFSIAKARRDLDYVPTRQNDLEEVIQWYKEKGYSRASSTSSRHGTSSSDSLKFIRLISCVLAAFALTAILLSWLPGAT